MHVFLDACQILSGSSASNKQERSKTCPAHLNTSKVDDIAEDIDDVTCSLEDASFAQGPNSAWTLLNDIVDKILKEKGRLPASADEFTRLGSMTTWAVLLMPRMKDWVSEVRINEGFLSKAQVTKAQNLIEGSHNWQVSMCAKINEEHGVCTARAGMHQLWYYRMQHDFRTALAPQLQADIRNPEWFVPCFLKHEDGTPKYQVIAFKPYPHLPDVHCGVVLEVYRGVALKLQEKDVPSEILDLLAYFLIL